MFFFLNCKSIGLLSREMGMESHAPLADPHIVGNAFVQKYYNHLYESPAQVHRFYLEDSVLGRPGSDGEMVSVSSLKVKRFSLTKKDCSFFGSNVFILF